ncbi:MAG: protein kinase, partial [Candidatus Eremiobacterota bacterium]
MEAGDLLAGRYRLIEVLGMGRIGTVWYAFDRETRQDVAIKIPHLWQRRNPEFAARFRRELLTGMRLSHPGIVRGLETGVSPAGVPYLVMELVRGAPIHLWFEQQRDFNRLTEVLEEVLDALSYAHQNRVVHQDLKPANILVDEVGQAHLCDFGLAGRLEDQTRVTDGGEAMADLAYLSPEQAMGERGDARSDLYSLGCVLYHLLAGRPPFQASDPASFLLSILNDTPPPPFRVRADVPAWLARLCIRLMARQPGDRPQTATEVLRLVQRKSSAQHEPMPSSRRRPMVGRDEELSALRTRLLELKQGQGSVIRVSGTAGIGKRTLVEEFLRRARPVPTVRV